jgi:hypothetical protein
MLIYGGASSLFGDWIQTVSAQQDPFLSRRIDQLENRFYSIESRLTRLETDSRATRITPQLPTNNDTELRFLQTSIDGLRLRVGEVECGLLKVDERTLSNAVRQGRNRSGISQSDRCRQDPANPVQLLARPER